MMTFDEWAKDARTASWNLTAHQRQAGYAAYVQHKADNMQSTIGELKADREAAYAVINEARETLLSVMDEVGLPVHTEPNEKPQVLDVAKAAAGLIRMLSEPKE